MARFSKSDWLELGLEALLSDGAAALRIDRLCARAERTKGSFYHHFKDRDAYVTDLMAYWEQRLTRRVIDKTGKAGDPLARILALSELVSGHEADLERALRRWAGSDGIVEAGVARVDKRRVDYLARLWLDAKDISSQQAIDLAVIEYASMVGFQQLYMPVTGDRRARIDLLYAQMMDGLPNRE
jgi:AcrR family transcriptional regulator